MRDSNREAQCSSIGLFFRSRKIEQRDAAVEKKRLARDQHLATFGLTTRTIHGTIVALRTDQHRQHGAAASGVSGGNSLA